MSWGLDLEVFRGSPMYGLSCYFIICCAFFTRQYPCYHQQGRMFSSRATQVSAVN
jgi:hypothetical protein